METPQVILVVDDEPFVLGTVCNILSYAGYEVLSATGSQEAISLATARTGPIHLLISDVVMPGLRGPELADRLLELHPETRCLLMAGLPDEPQILSHVLGKGRGFLPKPFLPQTLINKVIEVLGGHPGRKAAAGG